MRTENKKYYTGIGSRQTPEEILNLMTDIAYYLASQNFVLRSGGAPGADSAFEIGAKNYFGEKYLDHNEIFLPWKNFNNNKSAYYHIPDNAYEIASQYHPGWKFLKEPVKKLMARNVLQVLGENLNKPSKLLICWTPDGCRTKKERNNKTGGTGQAIAIANDFNIKIYNLANSEDLALIKNKIKTGIKNGI